MAGKKASKKQKRGSAFANLKQSAADFYRIYTSGLQPGDFKKLFTHETRGLYSHFSKAGDQEEPPPQKVTKGSRLKQVLGTAGRIFWGFILSLSPARRIIYGISFIVFIICAIIIVTAPAASEIRADAATISMYTFIVVSFLLALELADKLSAKGELELAQELQISLLPSENATLPGLQLHRHAATATEVGGDYHDFNFADGKSCIAIGDVSGHGLASGVVMAMAKSSWNTQLINEPEPLKVMRSVEAIVKLAGDTRTLMTFLHCQFDLEENVLDVVNAGHIYPLLYRKGNDSVEWLETPASLPLGVRQLAKFKIERFEVSPGDILLLVSDGAIESLNSEGECFDYSRLRKAFELATPKTPADVTEHIVEALNRWRGKSILEDDITIVAAGFKCGN